MGAVEDNAIEVEVEAPAASESASARELDTEAGQVLGPYVLCGPIASGGMASVHLAIPRATGEANPLFAVKRVHPHLAANRQYVEMFLDEARIAARIDHPNVGAVLDFGSDGQSYYLAMEYLHGQPMRDLMHAQRRSAEPLGSRGIQLLARIAAEACEGLHAAHEVCDEQGRPMQVVHRDVSPQNLIVTYDGGVKVVDFGIAKAEGRVHHTRTGMVKGKFSYMPPEQLRGEPVDRRADVWSLGVVLWEALAGRSLFRGRSESETVLAVSRAQVPSLRSIDPQIPEELETIVGQALQANPDDRFPTARAMARALRVWLQTQDDPVDASDLATWVDGLFPGKRDEQRAWVNRTVQHVLGRQSLAGGFALPRGPTDGSEPPEQDRSAVVRKRARPWRAIVLFGVAAVISSAAVAAIGLGGIRGPSEEPSASASVDGAGPGPENAKTDPSVSQSVADAKYQAQAGSQAAKDTRDDERARADAPNESGAGDTPQAEHARGDAPSDDPSGRAAASKRTDPSEETGRSAPRRQSKGSTRESRGTGTVNVVTTGGWAQVYLGRRHLGPTPGRFTLPVGRHVLTFRTEGGERLQRRTVRVRHGRVSRVAVELPR